ncbi:hypothetical protein L3081_13755 [Colwellia sp. MSW7]|uniref:EexN family lipoprotein n=1 Tax=Colwellia maritima TaxID=2912588 RepID=A0ABS9X1Y5_9GAMM|nr:hypothetical protein [Colwellia maritima]MCI2284256.1 hypothetical protein [Colwellia maritima]
MNKSKTILLLSIGLSIFGCSSSTELTSNELDIEQYPQKRSLDWCQKNYSSASVSTKDRQSSARHCDTQARQAYIDAKENKEHKEK